MTDVPAPESGLREARPLPLRLLPHLFLLAVLIVELLVGAGLRREESELRYLAREGTTEERLWAWHVLANRDPDTLEYDDDANRDLLNDEDPRLVDYSFTIDVSRLVRAAGITPRQEPRIRKRLRPGDALSSPDDVAEWWQRYVIYRRKVGGKTVGGQVRLRRDELRWYFDALAGRPLDEQTLVDRTNERQLRSYEVRQARIGEEGEDWPGYEAGRLPPPDED